MTVTIADPVRPPSRRRGLLGWAAIVVALVVVGVAGALLSGAGQWAQRDVLDPDSAGPQGTRALAQILRDQGIEVEVVRDREAVLEALAAGPATLALADSPLLSDDALETVMDAATDVVLIDPRARGLRLLFPDALPGGAAPLGGVDPSCSAEVADRAGPATIGTVFLPGDGTKGCYPVDEAFGLLLGDGSAAVDGRAVLTNEHLAEEGNAALGVGLLGSRPRLVWYVPGLGDVDPVEGAASLGELTPPWVSPAIVLLLGAALAAAIWKGRRFGPLVAERLPVTVRASETTEGRARLYARARDAVHAADQLRIGTLERIARMLGLGPVASAGEIADAAADRVGADPRVVRGILLDDLPTTDAQLVALSDRLHELETAVRNAVRPERNRP
ncbi:DUF4350 domain-containing protein [Microbacterium sp. Root61]|uniref:DUF4350 domain-containing protein n=1 Tax=Microbacterium sp. Root61 TaxID=1736570 RepID=UPI000AAD41BD|nr:DUF4350 domain-containing protein [Microbacterium sp. Root61]